MVKSTIAVWLHSLMIFLSPPAKVAALPAFAGWAETAEERDARYREIADDLYAVTFDARERPVFAGIHGRARTAAQLLALAFMEGGFAKDVDKGPCVKTGKPGRMRCDGGMSACLLQIKIGTGTTREGWTQADLFADRQKCFRAGLHIVQRSFRACRKDGLTALLDTYASGVCGRGHVEGQARLDLGRRLFDREGHPTEGDIVFLMSPAPVAPSEGHVEGGSPLASAVQ